ncbi:conserved hypothetical protein [Sporisorium reilianum SRZ2]|uniref:Uncharacterized protein n=1 Tax=Sporisorium reilianum (strain SRZ2) TaxID=999809 RepID=E6ZRF1_SPORE|nr:conserved hypothetical protein [Sporisorium reilianum SRZ2]
MADQSKWSSSRVAHQRTPQQHPPPNGTQQSRWATTTATASSSTSSAGAPSASSWRSRTTPSSNTWRSPRPAAAPPSQSGSSSSRWASPPTADPSISAITNTLSRTSIASHTPSIAVKPSTPTSRTSITRTDGLQPRDALRPLGGKPLDRLALLASPSRGLDAAASLSTDLSSQGSMDLTLPHVQAELRAYIATRIQHKAIPLLSASLPALRVLDSQRHLPRSAPGVEEKVAAAGEDELQQTVLLVRKLREALVASKRVDAFAVDVYELSAYLGLLCADVPQLAATLPRLVLELYPLVPCSSASEDMVALARHLGLEAGGGRMRLVALYMLHTLCLSGRATRLGQYAAVESAAPLHRALREYRALRTTLRNLYGEELDPHLGVCDTVYNALRDVDPFAISRLLAEGELDAWQRLVLLQVVPVVRGAAWEVARRAYMYMPISGRLRGMIQGEKEGEGGGDRFWVELLLLGEDVLPAAPVVGPKQEEAPDAWDADDPPTTATGEQEDVRLLTFLTSHFGATLRDRLIPLKQGHAIKLR